MHDADPAAGSPPNLRRFDRSSWFTLAIVLALAAASAWVYRAAFQLPVDGWYTDIGAWGRYQPPIYLPDVPLRNTDLRAGDVLVAVEGIPFEQLESAAARLSPRPPENWRFGEVVRYTVQRDGQDVDVMVTLGPQPPALGGPDGLAAALVSDPSLLSFPLIFLIGLGVFILRPRERAAQLLFLYGTAFLADNLMTWIFVSQGVADLFSRVTYWPRIALGNLLWTAWILPLFLHLFLVFPVEKMPIRRFPRALPVLIYGLGVGASAAYLVANVLGAADFSQVFVIAFTVPVLVLSAIALIHSALAAVDPAARARARWVVLGVMIGMVGPVILWVLAGGLSASSPLWVDLLFLLLTLALPISLAIAILRHNLWDIDLIINRTLVYSLLTGILVVIYFTGVVLLEAVLQGLSGQESQLAVVGLTLGIVALFQPLRSRIQEFVDRRFYRRKYDAEKVLAAFAATARNEVDLDRLAAELLKVVRRTTEPAQFSLWLADSGSEGTGLRRMEL